jgi:hypothetical protein
MAAPLSRRVAAVSLATQNGAPAAQIKRFVMPVAALGMIFYRKIIQREGIRMKNFENLLRSSYASTGKPDALSGMRVFGTHCGKGTP